MHVRTQVRDAVIAKLAAVPATILPERMRPIEQTQLPAVVVRVRDEEIAQATIGGMVQRTMTVALRCLAQDSVEDLDATLDGIAEAVEIALSTSITLGSVTLGGPWLQSISVDEDDEGEKPAGGLTLTYQVICFTNPAAPGSAL